jgi:hypothetical protein
MTTADTATTTQPTKRKLTDKQRAALLAYASENGRRWKQNLSIDWSFARARISADRGDVSAELQQVRNIFGPTWLNRTSLRKIREGIA